MLGNTNLYDLLEMLNIDVKKIGTANSATSLVLPEWANAELDEELIVVMNDEYSLSLFSSRLYRSEVINLCKRDVNSMSEETDMVIGKLKVEDGVQINLAKLPAFSAFVPEFIRLGEEPFIIQGNYNHIKLYYGPEAFKKSLVAKKRKA